MSQPSQYRNYPATRLRRLRTTPWIRRLVQQHHLHVDDLIWPLFVTNGKQSQPIPHMPNVQRHCIDNLLRCVDKAVNLGIPAIALFPAIDSTLKDSLGSESSNPNNLICRTVQAIKSRFPNIAIIGDVALDPYTDHGQDGIIVDNDVHNDQTLQALVKQATVQVQAGCDIIAPSDMMDGRIGVIRQHLENHHYPNVHLMAYSSKYHSAFYGPFRHAVNAGSNNTIASKASYQINPANSDEAIENMAMDIQQGADSIIVKPGMPYLDMIRRAKDNCKVPVFAYQVSGEYAMLQAAASAGMLDLSAVMMESLIAFKRAGADGIWTYFAIEAAEYLASGDNIF